MSRKRHRVTRAARLLAGHTAVARPATAVATACYSLDGACRSPRTSQLLAVQAETPTRPSQPRQRAAARGAARGPQRRPRTGSQATEAAAAGSSRGGQPGSRASPGVSQPPRHMAQSLGRYGKMISREFPILTGSGTQAVNGTDGLSLSSSRLMAVSVGLEFQY